MPAILVASKMKSGLPKPKPVHSAVPIPQAPSRPSVLALPPASLKTHIPARGQYSTSQPQRSKAAEQQTGGSPQKYSIAVFLPEFIKFLEDLRGGCRSGYHVAVALFVEYPQLLATPRRDCKRHRSNTM
ncbi:hypothetical protein OJAV_G00019370 [Oryzias javanicus]|uniref:Uncharacterized protein n=1 Tax=Oryzias javanicus TaxID=123683 RepID=A0A437DGM8_ORYJA|nr:hypothetical protein OJAV_G00019370 [Oryzias javanicus]